MTKNVFWANNKWHVFWVDKDTPAGMVKYSVNETGEQKPEAWSKPEVIAYTQNITATVKDGFTYVKTPTQLLKFDPATDTWIEVKENEQ